MQVNLVVTSTEAQVLLLVLEHVRTDLFGHDEEIVALLDKVCDAVAVAVVTQVEAD